MRLPFLDRTEETARLRSFLARSESSLAVLAGRRRCGKSRLLVEVLSTGPSVYYVADDRDGRMQRVTLAREIARVLPGFDRVAYPDWDSLFERWWAEAPPGVHLALDEFPSLVAQSAEVPSVLQRHLDRQKSGGPHLLLAGSSQRLMQGFVLDRSLPLFGRAAELLTIEPLPCGWLRTALSLQDAASTVEHWAVWGGIPRYWELAADFPDRETAVRDLILSPLGVLHDEPAGLLLDDLRDMTQAASILALIGQGCHRLSEIAGRLGRPTTSLSRPLQRLMELGLVRRDQPFGASTRDSKRSAYRIADPFLRFWFRFVEPERSRLESRRLDPVAAAIRQEFPLHVSSVWEDLVRQSVPRHDWLGFRWGAASSWWGPGTDGRSMELDVVAESEDASCLLVGEVKWSFGVDVPRTMQTLQRKAANLPLAAGRPVRVAVWVAGPAAEGGTRGVFTADDVVNALR